MLLLRGVFIVGLGLVLLTSAVESETDWSLILYYILGSAFYAINIPIRSAYVQELFHDSDYGRLNAILEVENQAAAVVTGMIAIFAIAHYGLTTIIVANVIFYVLAMICILAIRPPRTPSSQAAMSYLESLKAGVLIATHRPGLSLMLVAASMPYVVVILFTVLHPIALSGLEGTTGSTYALVEALFAVGAIFAGLCVATLIDVFGGETSYQVSLFLFAAIVVLQAFFPTYWGFLILAFGLGVGNALARILRQTLLMSGFQPHEAGRMAAFLQSIIMLMRAAFMLAVRSFSPVAAYPTVSGSLRLSQWQRPSSS
jgi:MFS family permease